MLFDMMLFCAGVTPAAAADVLTVTFVGRPQVRWDRRWWWNTVQRSQDATI